MNCHLITFSTYPEFLWTGSDTGSVIFEKMLWTLSHTGGTIGILSIGISLPLVLGWIVNVHGWTLLLAHSIVVEVLASLKI